MLKSRLRPSEKENEYFLLKLEKEKKDFLLKLFRMTVTTLSKLKLQNIEAQITYNSRCGDWNITIYQNSGSNVTFYAYVFQDLELTERNVSTVTNLIKKDEFAPIFEYVDVQHK